MPATLDDHAFHGPRGGSPVGGYVGAYLVQYSLVGWTTQLMAHQLRSLAVQCLDSLAAQLLDG